MRSCAVRGCEQDAYRERCFYHEKLEAGRLQDSTSLFRLSLEARASAAKKRAARSAETKRDGMVALKNRVLTAVRDLDPNGVTVNQLATELHLGPNKVKYVLDQLVREARLGVRQGGGSVGNRYFLSEELSRAV